MAGKSFTGALNVVVGVDTHLVGEGLQDKVKALQGLKVDLPVITSTKDLEIARKKIDEISKTGTLQDVITRGKTIRDKETGEEFRIVTSQLVKMKDAAGQAYEEVVKVGKGIDPKKFEEISTFKFSENAAKNTKLLSDELTRGGKQVEGFGQKAEKWMATAQNMTGKEAEQAKTLGAQLVTLSSDFQKAYSSGNIEKMTEIINKSRQLNKEFDIQVARTKGVAAAFRSWGNVLGNAIKQTVAYTFSLGGIRQITEFAKDAVRFTTELDKEMTKIKALGIEGARTTSEIRNLGLEYTKLAQSMGVTTLEIARGSVEWLRQGKTIEETKKLMESTMMLSKLGAIDAAQATEYLTAITNAYKVSVEDTVTVVDKLVAVDNIAATSSGELATALRYTSQTAKQAGVSLDELISYVATVSSVTRGSAESIGQAFKTIFARMQDVQDSYDLGSESINKVDYALKKVGLSILDQNNDWRNSSTVLEELSQKWQYLTEIQQNEIAKAIAGVRQREIFLVLMNNMNEAIRYQAEELTSTGLAAERYQVYMGGIEATSNTLKASVEELYQGILDSEVLVFFNNFLTGIVQLTNAIGGLKIVLIPVLSLLTLANVSTGVEQVLKLINGLQSLELTFRKLGTASGRKLIWENIIGTNDGDYKAQIDKFKVGTKEYNAEQIKLYETEQMIAVARAGEDLKEEKRLVARVLRMKKTQEEKEEILASIIVKKSEGAISEENAKIMAKEIVAKEAGVAIEAQLESATEKTTVAIEQETNALLLNNEQKQISPSLMQRMVEKLGGMQNIITFVAGAFARLSIASMAYGVAISIINKMNDDNIKTLEKQNEEIQKQVDNYNKLDSAEATNVKKQYLLLQARKNTIGLTEEEDKTMSSLAVNLKSLYGDSVTMIEDRIGHFVLTGINSMDDFDDKTKDVSKSVSDNIYNMANDVEKSAEKYYGSLDKITNYKTDTTWAASVQEYWQSRTTKGQVTPAEQRLLTAGFGEENAKDIMTTSPFEMFFKGKSDFAFHLDDSAKKKLADDAGNQISEVYDAAIKKGMTSEEAKKAALDYNKALYGLMLGWAPENQADLEKIFADSQDTLDTLIKTRQEEAVAKQKQEGYVAQARKQLGVSEAVQVIPVESLTQANDYLTSIYDELGKISDKYGNKPITRGMFNAEELGMLTDKYPDLLDMMNKEENAGLTMNQILEKYIKLKKDGMDVSLQAEINKLTEDRAVAVAKLQHAQDSMQHGWSAGEQEVIDATIQEISTIDGEIAAKQELIDMINQVTRARQKEALATEGVIGKLNSAKSAIDEYNQTGNLSIQTALEMIKNGNANALTIDASTGKISLNSEALKQNMLMEILTAKAKAQTAYASALEDYTNGLVNKSLHQNTIELWNNVLARKADMQLLDDLYNQVSSGKFFMPDITGGGGGKTPEQQAAEDRIKKLEAEKKKLQERLAEYKKYIDLKKKELKLQKEEKQFLDELAKKNKSLAKMKTNIALLALDDSEEAKAKRLKLEEDAANLEEDIAKTAEDRKYDLQVQALDDMSAKFEESINNQIKKLDDEIAKLNEVAQAAGGSGGGSVPSSFDEMGAKVEEVTNAVMKKLDDLSLKLTSDMVDAIKTQIDGWVRMGDSVDSVYVKARQLAQFLASNGGLYSSFDVILGGMQDHVIGTGHTGGTVNGNKIGNNPVEKFHSGGFAGKIKSNETFAKLLQGEYVATEGQMDNFLKNILPKIATNIPISNKMGSGDVNISMPINVSGNLDKSVMPDLEKMVKKTVEEINKTMKSRGYTRPTSLTSI